MPNNSSDTPNKKMPFYLMETAQEYTDYIKKSEMSNIRYELAYVALISIISIIRFELEVILNRSNYLAVLGQLAKKLTDDDKFIDEHENIIRKYKFVDEKGKPIRESFDNKYEFIASELKQTETYGFNFIDFLDKKSSTNIIR